MDYKGLVFTDMLLGRENNQRKSVSWIKKRLANSTSQFIPILNNNYFFNDKELVFFSGQSHVNISVDELIFSCYFLGVDDKNKAVFILDLILLFPEDSCAMSFINNSLESKTESAIQLYDFRQCLYFISKEYAAILGYGRALTSWHHSAAYCGYCSHPTKFQEGGHSRICVNEDCKKQSFPRTDPVVIMLVEYQNGNEDPKCLLAGHHRTPDNLVSTLAGFVDPGESLEQAVIREVYEEAGIVVEQVEYMASQPWPFPNSIMIGFYARAKSKEITIDPQEITSARWYSAAEVSQFSDWGANDNNTQIPTKHSIARFLIDRWVQKHI